MGRCDIIVSMSERKTINKNHNPSGRPKGVPNKTTQDARKAIALFVENNVGELHGWLKQVAEGDPDNKISPNPGKAFELFQSVVEYHVPKLARTELVGDPEKPLQHQVKVGIDFDAVKAKLDK